MSLKTVLITGASRGIGLATALRFAKSGWTIVAAARKEPDLAAAAKSIKAVGAACETIVADVGRPADAARLIETAAAKHGRIDALINNAGVAPLATIDKTSDADFESVYAVNMAAIFHTTRAVWPIMQKQGGGVIVNISSLASLDPFPGFAVYGASKAWVNVFSKAVAAEGKPHNIRVFSVAPGAVETPLLRASFPKFPAEKTLDPDQVAAVIESVCDDRMTYASGDTIFVEK